MAKMRFGVSFVKWRKLLYCQPTAQIIINGQLSRFTRYNVAFSKSVCFPALCLNIATTGCGGVKEKISINVDE